MSLIRWSGQFGLHIDKQTHTHTNSTLLHQLAAAVLFFFFTLCSVNTSILLSNILDGWTLHPYTCTAGEGQNRYMTLDSWVCWSFCRLNAFHALMSEPPPPKIKRIVHTRMASWYHVIIWACDSWPSPESLSLNHFNIFRFPFVSLKPLLHKL